MKIFRFLAIGLTALAGFGQMMAQECDLDISIANITKGNVVPQEVESKIEGKLTNALSKAGIIAAPFDSQFFIAARFDDAYNDIISGPSQKVVVKTTLTLSIGDAELQKVFASESFELKGVGSSDTQAYTRALNNISPANPALQKFLKEGKQKIIDYFDNNYQTYIDKARKAMAARNYDEALFYTTSIPSCCIGYSEANSLAMKIYKENTDYIGAQLLAKARGEWAASPDADGASRAYEYLSQIDPASNSAAAASQLGKEISKKVQRNWDFENIQKHKDAMEMEKYRINAARSVAWAWAKSRPRVVNRYVFLRRW